MSDFETGSNKTQYDLIVVGGGPAGMMCAGRAAEGGAHVLLLEKNKQLGKKLSITGGGRCNITNAEEDVHAFLDNFKDAKPYLFSPFSQFGVKDTFTFFEEHGLSLVVEARKRAFPETQKAPDVTRVMEEYVRQHRVKVETRAAVTDITQTDGVFTVETADAHYTARAVAVATGTIASPETGSTGDGFRFLRGFGHTIKKPNPHIVPLTTNAEWVHALSGTTLSFMTIRFKQNDPTAKDAQTIKTRIKKTGKVLFTHFGISGPLVLNTSSEVSYLLENGPVLAEIDAFPDTEIGDLDRRIWRLFEQNKNKQIKNVLPEMLPKKLAEVILQLEGAPYPDTEVNSVTKEARSWLAHTLKALTFPITGTLGYDKAVIADGGVMLDEVDTKTMESRLVPNLYLLGDVLNINRPSGGYSLQLCWTTGFVAGSAVGEEARK